MAESLDLFDNPNEEKFVDGQLKAVFFASEDSFYKVVLIQVTNTNVSLPDDEVVVTGNFGDLLEDNAYHFTGRVVNHPKYGQQFQADNYSNLAKTTRGGVIKYLSGDKFPGVGEKTAEKIVDILGTDALNKIDRDPSVLDKVGLKAKLKKVIAENLELGDNLENIIIGLNSYGFSNQLSSVIYEKYHGDALSIISENPYKLVTDIPSIGFKKADAIALQNGFQIDSPQRIATGLMYSIDQLCVKNGDTYTTTGPVLQETTRLLESGGQGQIGADKIANSLIELAKSNQVIGENDKIFPANLYRAEFQIAEHLNRIVENNDEVSFTDAQIEKQLRKVERKYQIDYDQSQINAITDAIKSPVFLLTGGPGTGKTTIINGIVNTFCELNDYSMDINQYKDKPFPVILAAPTGRAAKHMTDSTGLPASTIHRLLGLNRSDSENASATKDIDGELLIIDEMSMVDTFLFKMLVSAIPNHMKVVLVGDQDQLPSVGPGQVFHDLLSSQSVPYMKLDTIYRQDAHSSIIALAHEIHQGQLPTDFTNNQSDRSFIPCGENQIASVVQQVTERAKNKGFGKMDVQVLAPMYRGRAGIDKLNDTIQDVWQSPNANKSVTIRQHTYRIGDKVLQLENNPEKNVFNGDIGIIVSMKQNKDEDSPSQITIDYDEVEVTYQKNEWLQFTLAYCTSIHKAQGSEFKMVILPLVRQFSRMLQRNLLYTAVTRASDFLIMVGEQSAYQQCVSTVSANRKTCLVERLRSVISGNEAPTEEKVDTEITSANSTEIATDTENEEQEPQNDGILTMKMIQENVVNPMIGMQKIKPTDFIEAK